ncbi:MAG TPA: gluconate 2-dehydrogenase subunit 3 family protein [Steroidobacteraceae bacterium]|nr:gluconate 2-dehydrogenase subunit 3 family protein [Steroidobacteraceae bacterium]
MDTGNSEKLNRRALLAGAVFLLGGAAALTRFTRLRDGESVADGPAFTTERFALLEQISETLLPATDTAGAIDAGVPAFIREMLAQWGSQETRVEIAAVLDAVERHAWSRFGMGFLVMPLERRLDVMKEFDAARIAAHDGAYRKFKWLVLIGYYQSEIGATQELRFELVPGAWRACLPLSEVGRASAVY